jgi:hypothetical protein
MSIRTQRSGLRYNQLYEWREAARWAGYRYSEFESLEGDEQARIVAHYRIRHQIDAVLAEDQQRRMKRSKP